MVDYNKDTSDGRVANDTYLNAYKPNLMAGYDPTTKEVIELNVDDNWLTRVTWFPVTAFWDLRTAELSPVLQINFAYTVTNTEIWTIELTNGGTVTQADAMCVVNTSSTTGSTAKWETTSHATYRAWMWGLMRFTAMFTTGVAGTEQMVWMADTEWSSASHKNGYGVWYDWATFGFLRYQDDTLITIAQADWDDPMDWTGASWMTLDPTKLNVYFIEYQYLWAWAIKLWIESDITWEMILVNTILYAWLNTIPSIYNPNFHLMSHALNKATTADLIVKSASMAYFIEGKTKYKELQQPHFSTWEKQKTSVTTEVAILTIRNKSTYASKENFMDIILENVTASIESSWANNLWHMRLVKNATLWGTPSYTDINTTDSLVDMDTVWTTVTWGKTLLTIPLAWKNDRVVEDVSPYDIILWPWDTITVTGTSANSASMDTSVLWKELF